MGTHAVSDFYDIQKCNLYIYSYVCIYSHVHVRKYTECMEYRHCYILLNAMGPSLLYIYGVT